jgi:hypothetical protein
MTETPSWLPAIISVDGEWDRIVERLYAIFVTDIKDGKPRLNRSPVRWDRKILDGEKYEEGFWHLISKDDDSIMERLFDPRRAERLPWCRPTIDHFNDNVVKYWDFRVSRSRIETYLWLENFDYVVIFRKRKLNIGTVFFLITAYHVEGDSTKRNLRRKYQDRML